MARDRDAVTLDVGGRPVRVTHPDKVLYPATGTTKADVVDYYRRIAPHLLRHARGRPATRKRWVDGVGTLESPQQPFFEKNLPRATPEWLHRVSIEHSDGPKDYPLLEHEADLAWLGQLAALEVHVPQWRVDAQGRAQNPDRLVIDLDPGPGTGLPECVEVAHVARRILRHMGLTTVPVTSGSKGLHLYAGLDGRHDADSVKAVAKRLAEVIVEELPDLAVSQQKRSLREGRVLVDWSQNDAHKTTVAPYSLRGRVEPTVAVPRTWAELDDPHLHHLCLDEVLERMSGRRDPMARLGSSGSKPQAPSPQAPPRRSGTAVIPDPPMLASVGSASDLTGDDWVLEMKWDGIRALAGVDGDAVTLRSRSGEDLAPAFPDVVEALAALDLPDVVLDGEIVALDDHGAPSFSRLQGRLGLTGARRVATACEQVPAELRVFDLLRHEGTDLRKRTYDRRREALAELDLGQGPVSAPPALDGTLDAVIDESLAQGLEGVVAKKRGSTYRSGRRSRSWIKIKHERTADVVVVGWRPGRGGRAGDLGSLLVAIRGDDGGVGAENGELRYAGRVGSGLDARQREDLRIRLKRLERKTPPVEVPADAARDAVWVTPRLPGEVTMTGWTGSGLLRHPVWRGLRLDLAD